MEKKKNPIKEAISEKEMNCIINAIKKTGVEHPEETRNSGINQEKVVSILESFKGESVSTIMIVVGSAIMTLPAEAIVSVRAIIDKAMKVKMIK